ncbi:8630_t:CDS:2, partial [Scutellospora calospora]
NVSNVLKELWNISTENNSFEQEKDQVEDSEDDANMFSLQIKDVLTLQS